MAARPTGRRRRRAPAPRPPVERRQRRRSRVFGSSSISSTVLRAASARAAAGGSVVARAPRRPPGRAAALPAEQAQHLVLSAPERAQLASSVLLRVAAPALSAGERRWASPGDAPGRGRGFSGVSAGASRTCGVLGRAAAIFLAAGPGAGWRSSLEPRSGRTRRPVVRPRRDWRCSRGTSWKPPDRGARDDDSVQRHGGHLHSARTLSIE